MTPGERPRLLPVFLDLRGKLCTIVGGGQVAARRAQALLAAGASVRLVAPRLSPQLRARLREGWLTHVARAYRPGDLLGSALVFAATDDRRVNAAVCDEARRLGALANAADDPAESDFIMPAVVDRHPIVIAISTAGASPALARHLREKVEQAVPGSYRRLARLLGRLREEVDAGERSALPPSERARRWQALVESDAPALLRAGREAEAEALARQILGLPPARRAHLVIGSRGSRLALAQAELVASGLRQHGVTTVVRVVRTTGDRRSGPLPAGAFVREIEQALRRGEVDLAVHSLKDLPTGRREGLALAAVPAREDPRDALVSAMGRGLSDLPAGSRIGTDSLRRRAQVGARRPDLTFAPVRGNVDTRLAKLARGDYDALVLARAGLLRLGLGDRATETLPLDVCLPAPGQGALALQVRRDDAQTQRLLRPLDHAPTRLAVRAERAFLHALARGCARPRGGCYALPAGAFAAVDGERLRLRAAVADPRRPRAMRREALGPADQAVALGRALAADLLAAGADELLRSGPW